MKKYLMIPVILFSQSVLADQNAGQQCVTFRGDGAKKTFLALYPYTQGRVTAITAEESRMGDTSITTDNIFCRVGSLKILSSGDRAMKILKSMNSNQFQCGYFVASDGILSPCSDIN